MKKTSMSLINRSLIKAVIGTFAVIVATPIALLSAMLKRIVMLYLKSKTTLVQYVARARRIMDND